MKPTTKTITKSRAFYKAIALRYANRILAKCEEYQLPMPDEILIEEKTNHIILRGKTHNEIFAEIHFDQDKAAIKSPRLVAILCPKTILEQDNCTVTWCGKICDIRWIADKLFREVGEDSD